MDSALAVDAEELLAARGIPVRVVSMPSSSVFDRQNYAYRESVLPPDLRIVAVESAASDFWHKSVGRSGAVLGLDMFGRPAPSEELFKLFGLTSQDIAATIRSLLERPRQMETVQSQRSYGATLVALEVMYARSSNVLRCYLTDDGRVRV